MDKEDRRRLILDSSKQLFAEKGYHGTAVTDIITAANIARGTFYTYFSSKKGVFNELVDSAVSTIVSKLKPVLTGPHVDRANILRQLRINLSHALGPIFSDPCLAKIFVSEGEDVDNEAKLKLQNFYTNLITWFEESLEEGMALNIVRKCNAHITAVTIVGLLRGIIWSIATGDEGLDFHEVVEEVTANVAHGIIL